MREALGSARYYFENASGIQLTEDGKEYLRNRIMSHMRCECGASCFLMVMNDGASLACSRNPFEHKTNFVIEYDEEPKIVQVKK